MPVDAALLKACRWAPDDDAPAWCGPTFPRLRTLRISMHHDDTAPLVRDLAEGMPSLRRLKFRWSPYAAREIFQLSRALGPQLEQLDVGPVGEQEDAVHKLPALVAGEVDWTERASMPDGAPRSVRVKRGAGCGHYQRIPTRRSRPMHLHLRTALAALALSACIHDPAPIPAEGAPPAEAPPSAATPSALTWEDLGPARFAEHPAAGAAELESAGPPDLARGANAGGATVALRVVDVRAGRQHRVQIDRAALAAISARARELGVERGSLPDAAGAPPDEVVSDGWSDDDDSRTLRTNTTTWPYRAIGTLFDGGGDCTGTRIGPRHVLTAAHCIYNRETSSWNTINFKPGRNGTTSAPYGSSGPHWYWVPDEYITLSSGINGYDIGLIILDAPVGNGWIGYGAWSGGFLGDQDLWMRGYPRCNTTGSPVGCEPKTLWGDTQTCELGTFFDTDGDGWNRQIKTNCDGSAGQSGSSFYYYTSDGVPATIGVFSHHYCLGGCPASEHSAWPNVITRITPTYLDVINYFRAEYP